MGKRGEKRLIKGPERDEATSQHTRDSGRGRMREDGEGRGERRSRIGETSETGLWRGTQEHARKKKQLGAAGGEKEAVREAEMER